MVSLKDAKDLILRRAIKKDCFSESMMNQGIPPPYLTKEWTSLCQSCNPTERASKESQREPTLQRLFDTLLTCLEGVLTKDHLETKVHHLDDRQYKGNTVYPDVSNSPLQLAQLNDKCMARSSNQTVVSYIQTTNPQKKIQFSLI